MLEYPTLRQFFSQTFHFRLTRSNFCLWTTILRISSTFNILQPVECPQVSPLPLRLPLPLNWIKTSIHSSQFYQKPEQLKSLWSVSARKHFLASKIATSISEMSFSESSKPDILSLITLERCQLRYTSRPVMAGPFHSLVWMILGRENS